MNLSAPVSPWTMECLLLDTALMKMARTIGL